MASNVDDIINEPKLDASDYAVFSNTSEEIKFHYKLKFPGTYSIPTSNILDLLDNEVLFSHLQNSVKSFVFHAREIHKIDKGMGSIAALDTTETETKAGTKSKQNLNILTKTPERATTEVADVFEMPVSSADLSGYDSVHSIKIPWSSYENVNLKSSRHTFFRRKKPDTSEACGALAQVSQPMTGLVFERVEKPLPVPLKRKQVSPTKLQGKREKSRTLISNNQEINNVITLDEN